MGKVRVKNLNYVGQPGDLPTILPEASDSSVALVPVDPEVNVVHPAFGGGEGVRADSHALIRRVWGASMLAEPDKVQAIVRARAIVGRETGGMLQSAINIGRAMLDLRANLTEDELERGLREGADLFRGWSKGNLSKMMKVAKFVDERSLPMTRVPQSYTVLYEFTTFDEEQFEKAKDVDLFRPDVRRSEVEEFKRREHSDVPAQVAGATPAQAAEFGKVERRLAEMQVEMRRLRYRRTQLLAEIGGASVRKAR